MIQLGRDKRRAALRRGRGAVAHGMGKSDVRSPPRKEVIFVNVQNCGAAAGGRCLNQRNHCVPGGTCMF